MPAIHRNPHGRSYRIAARCVWLIADRRDIGRRNKRRHSAETERSRDALRLSLDSSLAARKQLARELHYNGDLNDSAPMNIWLHKQVMQELAENGGKVPADLRAA